MTDPERKPQAPTRVATPSHVPVLIERERELAAIEQRLAALTGGRGGVLVLEGGAGLGKTRLLQEAVARAAPQGVQILRATAFRHEHEFAFGVTLQLLEPPTRGAAGDDADRLFAGAASLARALLEGTTPDHAAPRAPFATVHGLYWVVVNLATRRPLLLCVDDLQWCDDASLRFLSYLAARVEELPVMILAANRPRGTAEPEALAQWRTQTSADTLPLRALAAGGVSTLVHSALGEAAPEFCLACREVSAGNPFRLHELLLRWQADELPATAELVGRLRTLGGEFLGQAALLRLRRLDRAAVELAQAAALLPDGTPLRRVAAVAQLKLEAAAVAADALAAEQILAGGTATTFAHPLIREAVYAEIPAAQCAVAHLRAARLLAHEGVTPEQVAAHLVAAPPAGDAWVVEMLRSAARRARSQGAPEPAARYLLRALNEPPAGDARAAVLVELGSAEVAAGIDSAADRLTEALDLQAEPLARAATALELSRALTARGDTREASEVLDQRLDELPAGDPAARELSYVVLADYLANAVFLPGLRRRAIERAAPFLSAAPAGVTSGERRVLAVLAMRSGQQGNALGDTVSLAQRAWSDGALLADEGPDGTGWLMVDWALELADSYALAWEVTAATIDAARRTGSLHGFANASYFHGTAGFRAGSLREAEADADQAIGAARAGWRRYLVGALVLKANILIEVGDLDAADRCLRQAGEHDRGSMFDRSWREHALGRLTLAQGDPPTALRHFRQAGAWLSERLEAEHTVLPWRSDAALAALAARDPDQAQQLIAPLLARGRSGGRGVRHARALRVQGLIAGGEAGLASLEEAARALADSQASLEHAYARADLGSALRRAGRRADAQLRLREALDLAAAAGARRLAARARDELVIAGARPRRERLTGVGSLTASERRVAELAGHGRTNAQIAQALFVTPKTVEFHLRHVYQKLEIPGRGALAAALAAP